MSPTFEVKRAQNPATRFSARFRGIICALLCWFLWRDLGLLDLLPLPWWRGATATIFVFAAMGAALSGWRDGVVLVVGFALSLALWLVVAFTPLAELCARPLIVAQTPSRADAVVVLLASIQEDDDFGTPSLERTLHGIALVQQKMAPRLILTQGDASQGSHRVAASRLMAALGVRCALDVVGPVRDTHDEALAVSALARQKGWKRILLVTSPLHSRRAALVFAKTGLQVVSTPCQESSYDLENLNASGARIEAFNAAIHEIFGLRVYRARGWI